jgi:hypothetical protein
MYFRRRHHHHHHHHHHHPAHWTGHWLVQIPDYCEDHLFLVMPKSNGNSELFLINLFLFHALQTFSTFLKVCILAWRARIHIYSLVDAFVRR